MNEGTRGRIIEKIEKDRAFFKRYPSKKDRLVHRPFQTGAYYILTAIAYLRPFKIRYRTLWDDTLSFYLPEGGAIYYYGFFEANLTNFFLRFIKEGDTFVDIGAHIGYYSNMCAHLVGPKGHIHSFEPTPRTYGSLVMNTKKFANVKTNNAALLDKTSSITFTDYGPKYSAFNTFKKRSDSALSFLKAEEHQIHVPAITLDSYAEENSVIPAFIKIDAEGADYLVLKGMTELLTQTRPLVSIEVAGGDEWKENHEASMSFLAGLSYVAYEVSDDGFLHSHEKKDTYEYDNLVFVPKEKESALAYLIK